MDSDFIKIFMEDNNIEDFFGSDEEDYKSVSSVDSGSESDSEENFINDDIDSEGEWIPSDCESEDDLFMI